MTSANAPYVPPGTGWPDDPATPDTPVAHTADEVAELAADAPDLHELCARQSVCRACDRLVAWREEVAVARRKAFADEEYWGRPIPGWGDPEPKIMLVGLAPAAHGGNRTGRIFTGDPSGDWLFASLHRVGLAAQATSVRAGDGQRLIGMRMAPTVRCAPPENKPTPQERDACLPWLTREIERVAGHARVFVMLGAFAWQGVMPALRQAGYGVPAKRPKFGHGVEVEITAPDPAAGPVTLMGCYHPSPHNTYTGRLTQEMTDALFTRAKEIAGV